MAGGVDGEDVRRLVCSVRTHAFVTNRRYVSIRCHDRRCLEWQWAKQHGQIAIHVWDIVTDDTHTRYEPIDKESPNARNSNVQP